MLITPEIKNSLMHPDVTYIVRMPATPEIKTSLMHSEVMYTVRMPAMTDAEYDIVKYVMEAAGGHWSERYRGFLFDNAPETLIPKCADSVLKKVPEEVAYREKWQYYPTPVSIADWMALELNAGPEDFILEPSAGRGRLIEAVRNRCGVMVGEVALPSFCMIEPNPDNFSVLKHLDMGLGADVLIQSTFEQAIQNGDVPPAEYIIMNPPFSRQRDIIHILLAYERLAVTGKLVALMSENSLYYNTPLTNAFQSFLYATHAKVQNIPHGAFKESGTMIDIVMVTLRGVGLGDPGYAEFEQAYGIALTLNGALDSTI